MSPEDRDAITTSIANLWSMQASVLIQLTRVLREEGVLSAEAVERFLQRIDQDADTLSGEDDQSFATGMLATVRTLLGDHGLR